MSTAPEAADRRPLAEDAESPGECLLCGGGLIAVFDLPALPLTGLYVPDPAVDEQRFDQGLMLCRKCGHGQLARFLPARTLYDDSYAHRSSASPIAVAGNDVLYDFIAALGAGRRFRQIVEIGCNDLYLLKKLLSLGDAALGIDPIWRGRDGEMAPGLHVLGGLLEDTEPAAAMRAPADLIVSAHTFEHMHDPLGALERLFVLAGDDALFVIEVPGFENLVRGRRFDQVFHQHLHYFSLTSLLGAVERLGGRYLAHRYNYDYWGGTLMLAFVRGGGRGASLPPRRRMTATALRRGIADFRRQVRAVPRLLNDGGFGAVYGFGAAQMLPVLAYHMGGLDRFAAILDDDPNRQGLYYPGHDVPIRPTDAIGGFGEAALVLTAPDAARPILARMAALKPRKIILPLQML